jgi:hypothetical protein
MDCNFNVAGNANAHMSRRLLVSKARRELAG